MKNNLAIARRKFLQNGAIALGTAVTANTLTKNLAHAESVNINPKISNKDITPDEALNLLIAGNKRFTQNQRQYPRQDIQHQNQLKIVGGYFDLNTAEVQIIT